MQSGYLADVVYRNTIPPTDIAICNAPEQQLQQSQVSVVELSASDSIISMRVCQDSQGVRGIAVLTSLGARLQCGAVGKHCSVYSSRGTYPLGGFSGSCAAVQLDSSGQKYTQVTRIFGTCWNTKSPAPSTGMLSSIRPSTLRSTAGWCGHHHALL